MLVRARPSVDVDCECKAMSLDVLSKKFDTVVPSSNLDQKANVLLESRRTFVP